MENLAKLKLFADGADLNEIHRLRQNPQVQGFTTNPTLMRASGVKNYLDFARTAIEMVFPLPISLEVFADDFQGMEKQALLLSNLGENVYVKIPITNTRNESSVALISKLSSQGVKVNVTAVFTFDQITAVGDALSKDVPSVISIFAGRIADAGVNPGPIVSSAVQKKTLLPKMEVIWASPRQIYNVVEAGELGCDIITMTPDLWKKLPNLGKSLDAYSLETVKMFYEDAAASGFDLG